MPSQVHIPHLQLSQGDSTHGGIGEEGIGEEAQGRVEFNRSYAIRNFMFS